MSSPSSPLMDQRKDLALSIVLLVFGLAIVGLSFDLRTGNAMRDPLGPRALPIATGLVIAGGAIMLIVRRVRTWRHDTDLVEPDGSNPDVEQYPAYTHRAMIIWAVFLLYGLLLQYVGFVILTPLVMIAVLVTLQFRRVIPLLLVSLGSTLFAWFLFVRTLNVRLPMWPW